MTASKDELRYAAQVAIPVVQIIYDRYTFGHSETIAPNVQPVADIRVDDQALSELKESLDAGSEKLMKAMFDQPAADKTLLGTIDFDPTTATGFVAFRGTENGTEWIDDFTPVPVPFTGLGGVAPIVHLGFLHLWQLARNSVTQGLAQLPAVDRLLVTGHSLGAAVASLCALELGVEKPAQHVACWTFASPRVYFVSAKRFNETIFSSIRVHNPADIVTNVPTIPFIHVTGGVAIRAKFKDFHSLMKTYQPGLEALIGAVAADVLPTEKSEDEMLEDAKLGLLPPV